MLYYSYIHKFTFSILLLYYDYIDYDYMIFYIKTMIHNKNK